MAWINIIDENAATGKLKQLYLRIKGRTEKNVANILKVHSIHPDVLEVHLNLYETIMFGESGLSRSQREMIAVVVSSTNRCEYWTVHHGESLRFASKDHELMEVIAKDYSKASISKQDKMMLHYAKMVTLEPSNTKERNVEALRRSGFSDRDIFDINQVTAYFNYVNRIADGLGVMLE